MTAPAHGTLTGTAPNLTYTPNSGYTGPDLFTFQVIDNLGTAYPSAPGTVSIIVGTAGTGLKGEYFDNIDFTNLKLTRTDAQVNFDWGTGSPNASLGADTFSVRWDGLLLVPETGTYTFSTLNSDGVRLYVNGVPVIDDYVDQTTNWKDGTPVNLTAGQMVDLHMRVLRKHRLGRGQTQVDRPVVRGCQRRHHRQPNGSMTARASLARPMPMHRVVTHGAEHPASRSPSPAAAAPSPIRSSPRRPTALSPAPRPT